MSHENRRVWELYLRKQKHCLLRLNSIKRKEAEQFFFYQNGWDEGGWGVHSGINSETYPTFFAYISQLDTQYLIVFFLIQNQVKSNIFTTKTAT